MCLWTFLLLWVLQGIACLLSLCESFWFLDSTWHCLSPPIEWRIFLSLFQLDSSPTVNWLESKTFGAIGPLGYSNQVLPYWWELAGDGSVGLSTACLPSPIACSRSNSAALGHGFTHRSPLVVQHITWWEFTAVGGGNRMAGNLDCFGQKWFPL